MGQIMGGESSELNQRSSAVNSARRVLLTGGITVAEHVPYVRGIETRKRRVAITSEDPPAKANAEFVSALHSLASFVKGRS